METESIKRKLDFSRQFQAPTLAEKKAAATKLGARRRCLEVSGKDTQEDQEDFLRKLPT